MKTLALLVVLFGCAAPPVAVKPPVDEKMPSWPAIEVIVQNQSVYDITIYVTTIEPSPLGRCIAYSTCWYTLDQDESDKLRDIGWMALAYRLFPSFDRDIVPMGGISTPRPNEVLVVLLSNIPSLSRMWVWEA